MFYWMSSLKKTAYVVENLLRQRRERTEEVQHIGLALVAASRHIEHLIKLIALHHQQYIEDKTRGIDDQSSSRRAADSQALFLVQVPLVPLS